MINRIVVTVDDPSVQTESRDCTLDCAATLALRLGAAVSMVHVEPEQSTPSELESITAYQWEGVNEAYAAGNRRRAAQQAAELEGMGTRMGEAWGVEARGRVTARASLPVLRQVVRESEGDLLVARLGGAQCPTSHLGEVPSEVFRHVDVPVLFIPPGTCTMLKEVKRVLVPLDGSDVAEEILPSVMAILPPGEGTIHLLSVVGKPSRLGGKQAAGEARERAAEYLASVAERAEFAGYAVETSVRAESDPAAAIRDEAKLVGADLIAMTTHGYTGLPRLLLGSVAQRVLDDVDRPLLLSKAAIRHEHQRIIG